MARKSRRRQIAEINENGFISTQAEISTYRTAVYARLSVEDTRTGSGDTLSTQVYFIKKYLEDKPYLKLSGIWTDNGFTGTNFDRPGFEALMDKVRDGEIDCIVVKDLSRFGRNYLETGKYIEHLLPFFGVRFIAINDGYDSNDAADSNAKLSVAIKSLINERYAHDISQKVNSAFKAKMLCGESVASYAPYGYFKDPSDKNKFVVDCDTAPVVRRMFELYADGKSANAIADIFNRERVETPSAYKERLGIARHRSGTTCQCWNASYIRKMLKDPVYTGCMAQGRTATCKFEESWSAKDRESWICVENTHSAIISPELWKVVQDKFALSQSKYDDSQRETHSPKNILKRKLFCGDCGYALSRNIKRRESGDVVEYYCRHHDPDGKVCPSKFMREQKLFELIFNAVKIQMRLCADYKAIAAEIAKQTGYTTESERLNCERSKLISEKIRVSNHKVALYDDYTEKRISKDDYLMINQRYSEDIMRLTSRISELEAIIAKREVTFSPHNDCIKAFESFKRRRTLSGDMSDVLIKKVIVYSRDRIEVEFNFADEFKDLIDGVASFQKGGAANE